MTHIHTEQTKGYISVTRLSLKIKLNSFNLKLAFIYFYFNMTKNKTRRLDSVQLQTLHKQ